MQKIKIISYTLSVIGLIVAIGWIFKYHTHYHWYHLAIYHLIGDRYKDGDGLRKYYSNAEEIFTNPSLKTVPKWYFRPNHLGNFCLAGLVADANRDGQICTYIAGDTKDIYCLNGKTGEIVWQYTLPFGKFSELSYLLFDVDHDGKTELLVGTCGSTLPNRVYCLSSEINPTERVIWHVNVHGDFIQGGLTAFRNENDEARIIVSTRDAPYSRGTLYVLDQHGKDVITPISGVDNCNCRPAIADLDLDGHYEMVIGSHSYYGAKFGWKITALRVETGEILWSTDAGYDTGAMSFPICDFTGDGISEVIGYKKILDAKTGQIIFDFEKNAEYNIKWLNGIAYKDSVLYRLYGFTDDTLKHEMIVDYSDKKIIAKLDTYSYKRSTPLLDINNDGQLNYISAYIVRDTLPKLNIYLVDAYEGSHIDSISIEFDENAYAKLSERIPSQIEFANMQKNGPTNWKSNDYTLIVNTITAPILDTLFIKYASLSDVDGDSKWELLATVNSMYFCFDLPYSIADRYKRDKRFVMNQFIDNTGFDYDYPYRDRNFVREAN